MAKNKFKEGDVVRLNSGGPDMTIIQSDDGIYYCSWPTGKGVGREGFIEEVLTLVRVGEKND